MRKSIVKKGKVKNTFICLCMLFKEFHVRFGTESFYNYFWTFFYPARCISSNQFLISSISVSVICFNTTSDIKCTTSAGGTFFVHTYNVIFRAKYHMVTWRCNRTFSDKLYVCYERSHYFII